MAWLIHGMAGWVDMALYLGKRRQYSALTTQPTSRTEDRMTSNAYSPLWFRLFMPQLSASVTQQEVAFLARQLPLPQCRRVLDLCCGYGRHGVGLAAQGYEVTGLDRDTEAVAEAQRRSLAAGQDVAYVVGDMRAVGELHELSGGFAGVI